MSTIKVTTLFYDSQRDEARILSVVEVDVLDDTTEREILAIRAALGADIIKALSNWNVLLTKDRMDAIEGATPRLPDEEWARKTADLVAAGLREAGIEAEVIPPTGRFPSSNLQDDDYVKPDA